MENNNVKQFINLLLNGESFNDAMNESGVGEMKIADVLKAVSCGEC